jgi:hypothetical protein
MSYWAMRKWTTCSHQTSSSGSVGIFVVVRTQDEMAVTTGIRAFKSLEEMKWQMP